MAPNVSGLMTGDHEVRLNIRCTPKTKERFLGVHERLGAKNLGDTLDALVKANASGPEKALRVVELESQLKAIDDGFRQTVLDTRRDLVEAQKKVDRAVASRKAAHNKYHALIRYIQNNVPHQVLANLNLSKFRDEKLSEPMLQGDSVSEQLRYIAGQQPEGGAE